MKKTNRQNHRTVEQQRRLNVIQVMIQFLELCYQMELENQRQGRLN